MRILVISVTRNRKGQPVRAERIVEGEMIRLGRGTQCEIHLPDPRVALFHAAIYAQGDSIFIHAPEAELAVDGGPEREARLTPRVHIALGPYEMTVEPPPPGCDLALAIELVRPLPDDLAAIRAKSRTSLEATALSKRGPAWILAIRHSGISAAPATRRRSCTSAITSASIAMSRLPAMCQPWRCNRSSSAER